jgi:predicted secreted protein
MNFISAIVLYLVIWFMCVFIILPLRIKSQDEDGEVVPGTPASAPTDPMLKKKAVWVTILATVLYVPIVVTIVNGWITIDDLDFYTKR